MDSPKWNYKWEVEDIETHGRNMDSMYKQVVRLKYKPVVGAKTPCKQKSGQVGRVEKYK